MPDRGPEKGEVTRLLQEWSAGNPEALATLMPLVYSELKKRARYALRRERPGHTLEPTALVNEVYLRLVDQTRASWETRKQFFGVAAQMMRRILLDYHRSTIAARRPPPDRRSPLNEEILAAELGHIDLLDLDAALTRLRRIYPRPASIVELRFFVGLSVEETAEILGLSMITIKREFRLAKAWLLRELSRP